MAAPLGELRVVDLSAGISGGFCSKLLTQYGATVIKVEPDGGDSLRQSGPFLDGKPGPERSVLFNWLHSGQRSVVLDCDTEAGLDALAQLLAQSDVLLDSAPPGRQAARGLDQKSLESRFPRLVCTSITPFGGDGPYADYEATPAVLHALGGWVHTMGEVERPPVFPGAALGLVMTGVFAAVGTLAAQAMVDEVGGQAVEVAAQEVIAATMIYDTVAFQYIGIERSRTGRWLLAASPNLGIQPAREGWCGVQAPYPWQMRGLFESMGRPELADDPRFRTPEARALHAEELDGIIGDWTREQDAEAFYHAMQKKRLPFHTVPSAEQVFGSEQLAARDYWDALPVDGRTLPVPGLPFRLEGWLSAGRRLEPAPSPGEHTRAVLEEAGLPAASVAALTGGPSG